MSQATATCPRCDAYLTGPIEDMRPDNVIIVGSKVLGYKPRKKYMICPRCGYKEELE